MNIFVYSDESGVFDKVHNDVFVFGGVVFLSKDERDIWSRKYIRAEESIRKSDKIDPSIEAKAINISGKSKGKLYRSLNNVHKFGVVVKQSVVHDPIFYNKKSKQRYLDYVYKIGIKRKFEDLISKHIIDPAKVENLFFFVDEHTTATDGRYELREALEQEFKIGTYNYNYSVFYPPIFPNINAVEMKFCNSQKVTLVRAADIIANRIFFVSMHKSISDISDKNNLLVTQLP